MKVIGVRHIDVREDWTRDPLCVRSWPTLHLTLLHDAFSSYYSLYYDFAETKFKVE